MNHSFNVEVATQLGVEKAILIENILFWWRKDKANNQNYHDGRYWVYNSSSAFAELFPYMSQTSIKRYLKDLVDEGYLETGNYNKVAFDKTLWYTPTDMLLSTVGQGTIDGAKMDHGEYQSGPTIPVINPVVNPVNTNVEFEKIWKAYPHFRTGNKKEAEKIFKTHTMTSDEILREINILKWKNFTGISDSQYNPQFFRRLRDITPTQKTALETILTKIVEIMRPKKDYPKNQELVADFPDVDVKGIFNKNKQNDPLTESIRKLAQS